MKFDLIIIGAGAAGLTSAYHAISKNPQLNILVLEKEGIPGRKFNATGNGKCNLTNQEFRIEAYHADSKEFMADWFHQNRYREIVSFFEDAGILLYEKNGYYYPLSNQAKQVSNLLFEKSQSIGVQYRFRSRVIDIRFNTDKEQDYEVVVQTENQEEITYHSTYILISTGGYASAKLGGCKDGYKLSKKLGLVCNPIYPVLSPIYVDDDNLSVAKGVRIDGNVTLRLGDGSVYKESGQIQFNDNNLSGIVMMNMSCYYNYTQGTDRDVSLYVDVMADYSWEQLKNFFDTQKNSFPTETIGFMLHGILPVAFTTYICKRLNLEHKMLLCDMTEKQMNRLTSTLKKLEFTPRFVDDFDKAQVTGGGVSTDEISVDSFECKQYKNLYIAGEVLDVNGKCGGYNLTFAILSGLQAVDDILSKETL